MSAIRPLTRLLVRHSACDYALAMAPSSLLRSVSCSESTSSSFSLPLTEKRPALGIPPLTRGTGQVGITFAPFPKNELHIRQFNLKRELAKRRALFLVEVDKLVSDIKSGALSVDTNRQVSQSSPLLAPLLSPPSFSDLLL